MWSNMNKIEAVNSNNNHNKIALLSAIITEFSDDLDRQYITNTLKASRRRRDYANSCECRVPIYGYDVT